MRNAPETISVKLDNGLRLVFDVIEPVYADRTCGQWESGYATVYPPTGVEYFISDSGVVWKQPENIVVGIAPEIKAQYDRMEAQLEAAFRG